MLETIGEILPLAVVIAISPTPIVATILMLLSPRARSTGIGFLVGWIVALLVQLAIFSALSNLLPGPSEDGSSPVSGALKILIGVALVVLGIRKWTARSGEKDKDDAAEPAWMKRIDTLTGRGAIVFGMLLGANPKNILLALAAGVTIGSSGLTLGEEIGSAAAFVGIAAITVAVPVIVYLAAARHMQAPLIAVRTWLVANNATVMSVQSLVIGVVVIGAGIGSFS